MRKAVLVLAASAGLAFPQAMVEHAITSGAGAGAAAGLRNLGKQTAAILEKAGSALPARQTASGPAAAAKRVEPAPKAVIAAAKPAAKPAAPAPAYEDPAAIERGLAYAELVRRFGPPSLSMSGEDGQRLWYGNAEIELRDGRVANVLR